MQVQDGTPKKTITRKGNNIFYHDKICCLFLHFDPRIDYGEPSLEKEKGMVPFVAGTNESIESKGIPEEPSFENDPNSEIWSWDHPEIRWPLA